MKKSLKFSLCLTLNVLITIILMTGCQFGNTKEKTKEEAKSSMLPGGSSIVTSTVAPTSTSLPTSTPEVKNHVKKPDDVRAVYLSGWTAGSDSRINEIVELSKTTDLNAVVIDIKDDNGMIGYKSEIKEVKNNGAIEVKYDVDKVIKKLHEGNVFVIARLVCFKDPILAKKNPEIAYKKKDGSIWKDNIGRPWANPLNEKTWDYNINIALEAIDKGFDGIQYDYVRFCNDGDFRSIYLGENFNSSTKSDAIAAFLKKSNEKIYIEKGIELSADVFGISAVSTGDDVIIGQNWEKLSKEVSCLSPMVYPSHYATSKQNGTGQEINGVNFDKPDLEPYSVVYNTLLSGKKRLDKEGTKVTIRPYLQAFTAPWNGAGYYQKYGIEQIRQQIKAVYDAGYTEWILWDPANKYPMDVFEKK